VLSGLRCADFLDFRLVVLTSEPAAQRGLWDLYVRLDRRVFGTGDDPFEPEDASPAIDRIARIAAAPVPRDGGWDLASEGVEAIRSHHLDVLVDLGSRRLGGHVLGAARHGVWAYRWDGSCARQGGAALFRPIFEGGACYRTTLELLGEQRAEDRVIYSSLAATVPTSRQRSLEPACWKTAEFALRRLRDLYERGPDSLESASGESSGGADPDRSPGAAATLRYLARVASRLARRRIERRGTRPRWQIGVRRRADDALEPPTPAAYASVPQPPDRSYADPFPIESHGRRCVFFEDVPVATGKGVISYVALGEDAEPGEIRTALERDYHLSYPFLFQWNGAVWMIPETEQNRSVELYRAVQFPDTWRLEKTLFEDVRAVDATLLEHGGRFWLFTCMSPPGGSLRDELFLFHADSPLGDWVPHARNPVVSDVTRARPGGTIFRLGDALIRPGQDGAPEYGRALTLNRIDVLSELEYRETPISRIEPDWQPNAIGTHTLSRSETLEAIDWKCRVPRRRGG
jgi:hypothetical protein